MSLRLVEIETGAVLSAPLPAVGWVRLPNGDQVSPAVAGWEGGGDPPLYRIEEYEPPAPEPPRATVLKSVIISRLTDEQLAMVSAAFAQPENLRLRERWYAPDRPTVYCDDPDAIAMVLAIGADPEVILAPG
jgi:hypothetical protein